MEKLELYAKFKKLFLSVIEKEIANIEETYFNSSNWKTLISFDHLPNTLFEYYSKAIEINFQSEFYRVVKNRLGIELNKAANLDLKTFIKKDQVKLETGIQNTMLKDLLHKDTDTAKLKKEYTPDLIFCNPVKASNPIFAGALKTNPNLTYNTFKYEINQIIELITNYNFHFGLFLSVNTDSGKLEGFKKLYKYRNAKRHTHRKQNLVLEKITIAHYDSIHKKFSIID